MNTNILFTDIVGYSKLTGNDQALALELLNEHDKIIEPIILRYDGKILKRIGDAIVAIFDKTGTMIQASVEIQQSLKNRNIRTIKSRQLVLRIGLHYGNIIIKDDEVYGAGYDLVSEIEPICEYGGIAISHDVYLQSHLDSEFIVSGINNYFFINPVAKFHFKSSSHPILIYKLYLNLLDWYDEPYQNTAKYLLDQHVDTNKYDINIFNKISKQDLSYHLDVGQSLLDQHNLSYAIYHYQFYINYSTNVEAKIQLSILKIFAECGLVRLVDSAFKKLDFKGYQTFLIKGINLFNQKRFDQAFIEFEQHLESDYSTDYLDSMYYVIIILFRKKSYDKILDFIASKQENIKKYPIHALLLNHIRNSIFNQDQKSLLDIHAKFLDDMQSIENLNDKKFGLFLYYILIKLYQEHVDSEQAINIQNDAIALIKICESSISGFLLKQLFFKNPELHKMIMEPIELEFIDDEGIDDYDFDDILIKQKEAFQFCASCGHKNNIEFQFCIKCGEKLIS